MNHPKMKNLLLKTLATLVLGFSLTAGIAGCQKPNEKPAKAAPTGITHPEWSKNANIYEVNVRQFSKEGTFKGVEEQLPRLKKMGVDILWLMPIHPIGEKNRKGPLGSYYAVKDYKAVNPNFGTLDDLKALVNKAHELGMHLIIDWVANHTSWDNVWTKDHPDWYTHDEEGNFKPPVKDWSDVIELDYSNQAMRNAMIDAMTYWVKEANIDGFRCDVAGSVPTDFWVNARHKLDAVKPVFMLAEAEDPELHQAFDMTYAWEFHHITNAIAKGEMTLDDLDAYMAKEDTVYARDDYRMYFTSNHDENTWNGSAIERYGKGYKTFAVLAATIDGMPLVYNGQESAMKKRLEFFKKDPIDWGNYPLEGFYSTLLHLKTENPALWNGAAGGTFEKLETNNEDELYAYRRVKGEHEVLVVLNFSEESQNVQLVDLDKNVQYTDAFSGKTVTVGADDINLVPWGYLVLQK